MKALIINKGVGLMVGTDDLNKRLVNNKLAADIVKFAGTEGATTEAIKDNVHGVGPKLTAKLNRLIATNGMPLNNETKAEEEVMTADQKCEQFIKNLMGDRIKDYDEFFKSITWTWRNDCDGRMVHHLQFKLKVYNKHQKHCNNLINDMITRLRDSGRSARRNCGVQWTAA